MRIFILSFYYAFSFDLVKHVKSMLKGIPTVLIFSYYNFHWILVDDLKFKDVLKENLFGQVILESMLTARLVAILTKAYCMANQSLRQVCFACPGFFHPLFESL